MTHSPTPPRFSAEPPSEALAPLWQACFGEDPASAEAFRLALACADVAMTLREGDEVVGAFFAFAYRLADEQGYYIYGLGTRPDRQGRGYMRRLLTLARQWQSDRGKTFALLIPATPQLAHTYTRLGFLTRLPLGAAADPACAQDFYGTLLDGLPRVPFDSDYRRLYGLSARHISEAAFRMSLCTLSEKIHIDYITNGADIDGYLITAATDPTRCFDCSPRYRSHVRVSSPTHALLQHFTGKQLTLPFTADPLPR
ncbi:MAG: GNAT family N-acetyltransferase [Eubacteriales bacterium]